MTLRYVSPRAPNTYPSDSLSELRMCGVFGIFGHSDAAKLSYLGLHALQHRGQESAGIVSSDSRQLKAHRGLGHVIDVFPPKALDDLKGVHAIGHVRYATAGGGGLRNAQPHAINYVHGSFALAHNGNLTNADLLRHELEEMGSIFQGTGDTEVIVHLIAKSKQATMVDRIADALTQVRGAYSILVLTENSIHAMRDPRGIRPLCLGRMKDGSAYVFSSEPSSFELIDATFIRDVAPGELISIDDKGIRSLFPFNERKRQSCIFEYVYFARPDATLDGVNVYEARKNLGRALAREHGVEADFVIPVPDSGLPATIGYAQTAGIPFEMGLVRSHYIGRTFIEPEQSIRHFGVRLKLSPIAGMLRGKRVVVVDDSIVRGTTSRKIVKMLRDAGAKEIHMRIASPPTQWPCYYGVDTPTRSELIASTHSVEEINQYITSDTLAYLSIDALTRSVMEAKQALPPVAQDWQPENSEKKALPLLEEGLTATSFCHACWSGEYPVPFTPCEKKQQLPLLHI